MQQKHIRNVPETPYPEITAMNTLRLGIEYKPLLVLICGDLQQYFFNLQY